MSKIGLPSLLSLAFHLILLLGIGSIAGLTGHDGPSFVVELVASSSPEFSGIGGEGSGPAAGLPPRNDRPVPSRKSMPSPAKAPASPQPSRVEEKETVGPVQEETLPPKKEPDASPDPTLPVDRVEGAMPEERSQMEPLLRLVAGGGASGGGSGGAPSGGGDDAQQPLGGGGLSGGAFGNGAGGLTGEGGGGWSGSGLVMPRPAGESNPRPRYPEGARVAGREGTALLKVTVLPDGKVGETSIERSSGHPDLDQSALEAVTQWRFLPARRGEKPVPASIRIPVTFALNDP
ncbi:MAG TPA: energy transducer TonB [Candidatus Manganitrophaceae bacterium]|nr:energy transducer TonB [Candidatus Manganitrophaceae bacterium]